ncbi:amino acid permease [Tsukamurella sputi]|uniref:Amino acid permease n=1 Tax=Tsukamurella sputi TaxID=2591848 RepID=A0A5C5RQN0_9ACTN|nr:amino acid permease [Tsukamurella sputi]TWS24471.1 amino acid permease [Tsukamurella sputi]
MTAVGTHLRRSMKPRQLIMISLGGAIGAGLFVGTGAAVGVAGPAIAVSFLIAGLVVVLVMRMMGELVAADPASGAFSVHAEKALGPVAGRTIGWLYWVQVVAVVAAEATAAAAIVGAAFPLIPQWAAAFGFMVFFTAVNLVGVGAFGAFEYWFAAVKVLAVLGFLGVGLALLFGWLPGSASPGTSNLFGHGGFAPTGITGVAAGLLIVIFAFGGTEIVAIAAAETTDPQRNTGRAIRTIVWRILVFYVGSVLLIVALVPWNSPALATGPFVEVLRLAHVPGAAGLMSLIIVVALLSSLNAMLFSASRMIHSLSERGAAPRAFSALTARSVPRNAVLASVAFGFLTVVLNYLVPDKVLPLLLNVVGSTILVLWTFVAVSQIRLRNRARREGTEDALPLKMWCFPYLSYLALALLAGVAVLAMFDTAARNQLLATAALTVTIAAACWWSLRHAGR